MNILKKNIAIKCLFMYFASVLHRRFICQSLTSFVFPTALIFGQAKPTVQSLEGVLKV